MDLRICLECGRIWDSQKELPPPNMCAFCRNYEVQELGQLILKLRRADLIHHGKLK